MIYFMIYFVDFVLDDFLFVDFIFFTLLYLTLFFSLLDLLDLLVSIEFTIYRASIYNHHRMISLTGLVISAFGGILVLPRRATQSVAI